jgi:LysM repeat protein
MGDTLSEIALRYGVSVQALKKINRLSSFKLVVGQKLHLPS